jgi:hypothetical protein
MMFGPHAAEIAGRVYRGLPSKDKQAAQADGFVSFAGSERE